MAPGQALRTGIAVTALVALSGCMEGAQLPAFLTQPGGNAAATAPGAARMVEQDVEAPEVFEARAQGLWDGRPSLGGIWVAHPDVTDPERVMIRNTATGQSVAGALFRRERDVPGPPVQVSAEAAAAIGLLAGQPAELHIVALRRVEVPVEGPAAEATAAAAEGAAAAPPPGGIRPRARPAAAAAAPAAATPEAPADPLAAAARAIAAAEAEAAADATDPPSRLNRPWLQLGTFTDEANARSAADTLIASGMEARVAEGSLQDKPVWRVLAGPAADRAAMRRLVQQAAALGFADAYPVAR